MLRHELGELERDEHAIVRVNVAPMLTSEAHQKRSIFPSSSKPSILFQVMHTTPTTSIVMLRQAFSSALGCSNTILVNWNEMNML